MELEASLRDDAKRIAPKLDLAEVGEAALQLRDDWSQHFARQIAQQSGREPTVTDLRRWLDLPDRRGLREDLQDLVILTWLAKSNRSLYRFGQPFKGEIGNVPNECEVREQPLPTTTEWEKATKLAGEMLDPAMAALYRSAPGLVEFSRAARKRVTDTAAHLLNYLRVVDQLMTLVQTDAVATGEPALRKTGATRLRDWFAAMESSSAEFDLVNLVARLDFSIEEIAEAKAVLGGVQALARVEAKHYLLNSLRSIASGSGEFAPRANQILESLAHAVLRYEYVDGLQAAIAQFERDAGTLVADVANRTTPPSPPPQPTPEPEPEPGMKAPQRIERARLVKTDALKALADARTLLEGLGEVSVDIQIVIREQE